MVQDYPKILVIDDDEDCSLILSELIKSYQWGHDVKCASRLSEGLNFVYDVDIVIYDLQLPDAFGIPGLKEIAKCGKPIIVVTGNSDELLSTTAIYHGADDYLVKGSFDRETLKRSILYTYNRHKRLELQHTVNELRKEIRDVYKEVVNMRSEYDSLKYSK